MKYYVQFYIKLIPSGEYYPAQGIRAIIGLNARYNLKSMDRIAAYECAMRGFAGYRIGKRSTPLAPVEWCTDSITPLTIYDEKYQ